MPKLSKNQFDVIAQMLGNGAIAWLAVGVISAFLERGHPEKEITNIIFSLFMGCAFAIMAVSAAGRKHGRK